MSDPRELPDLEDAPVVQPDPEPESHDDADNPDVETEGEPQ